MKKILILVMSCNDKFFLEQEKYIDDTWGKDIIDGKYPNISLYKYRGSEEPNDISKDNIINIYCEDDIKNTFKKTYLAFRLCEQTFDYDYIFRVNTSTYINVPLLNAFIQSLEDETVLWCSELYSLSNMPVPYPLMLYGRGNGLLFSKLLINIILREGFPFLYLHECDDNIIGNILNSYWIKSKTNYLDKIKSFRHGWFRCINTEFKNNHTECAWCNKDCSFDFMKDFVTIQIKRYWEREIENNNYIDLYNDCFSKNEDNNISEAVNKQYEYSKNPNIFIGSILGYVTFKDWIKFDRTAFYKLQIENKSADDPSRGKKDYLII